MAIVVWILAMARLKHSKASALAALVPGPGKRVAPAVASVWDFFAFPIPKNQD